jgi:hypothetical protein
MTQLLTPAATLPPALLDQIDRDVGKGVSRDPSDLMIPFCKVLQSGSPAVDKHDPAYLANAEAGDFQLGLSEIRSGVAGIEVVFAEMLRAWVEFLPARGGFVGRHASPPEDVETIRADGRNWPVFRRRSNGNVLEERRELFCLCEGENYILSCGGTLHSFARRLQTHFRSHRHPKTGEPLPVFARRYKLETVATSNSLGRWFTVKFSDLAWASEAQYFQARSLHEIIASGGYMADYNASAGPVAQQDAA